MEMRINSAYRLHRLFSENLGKFTDNINALDAWLNTFGIKQKDQLQKTYLVLEKLNLIKIEAENTLKAMNKVGLSEDTYAKVFEALKNILSPQTLYNPAGHIQRTMNPEIINLLKICYQLLTDEEELISEEDLASIKKEVESLEEYIKKEKYSPIIKKFVEEHLELLHRALENYKIQGLKAFNKSYHEAHTVIFENSAIFSSTEENTKGVFRKLNDIWCKVITVYDRVSKTNSIVNGAVKLLGPGSSLFETVGDMIQQ